MRNLNKPPRYNVASIQAQKTLGGDVMQAHEQGDYVEFRDYQWLLTEKQRLDAENARLKAECQARQAENSVLAVECDSLKAEVERLTKAGDALAGKAISLEYNDYWSEYEKVEDVCIDEVEAWHKAKEGKQS